jgi:hypothetical protein
VKPVERGCFLGLLRAESQAGGERRKPLFAFLIYKQHYLYLSLYIPNNNILPLPLSTVLVFRTTRVRYCGSVQSGSTNFFS